MQKMFESGWVYVEFNRLGRRLRQELRPCVEEEEKLEHLRQLSKHKNVAVIGSEAGRGYFKANGFNVASLEEFDPKKPSILVLSKEDLNRLDAANIDAFFFEALILFNYESLEEHRRMLQLLNSISAFAFASIFILFSGDDGLAELYAFIKESNKGI